MAIIGPTAAKVTPIMTGRRMPKKRPAPKDRMKEDDAAGEQVGIDQQRDLFRRQFERVADDQRHRDGAGIHHQDVLKSERGKFRRR